MTPDRRPMNCDYCGGAVNVAKSVHLMFWPGYGFGFRGQRPYPIAIKVGNDAALSFEPVCRDCYDYIVAEVLTLGDELRRRRNGISCSEERGRRST